MTSARGVGQVVELLEQRATADGEWSLAPWAGALYAEMEDGSVSPYSDRAISVEAASSAWATQERGEVLRRASGTLHTSTVCQVRWLWAVPTDDGSHPYRVALDAEAGLIRRLITTDGSPIRVLVESATRQIAQEGWVMGTIRLTATHHMPI